MSDYDEGLINKGQSIYDEMSHNGVYLFSFSLIGLTETKLKVDQPQASNIDLDTFIKYLNFALEKNKPRK